MTRDELFEEVAECIADHYLCNKDDKDLYMDVSSEILSAIFAALKEPTHEMCKAYYNTALNDSASTDWQAMLNASPLAPKGE